MFRRDPHQKTFTTTDLRSNWSERLLRAHFADFLSRSGCRLSGNWKI